MLAYRRITGRHDGLFCNHHHESHDMMWLYGHWTDEHQTSSFHIFQLPANVWVSEWSSCPLADVVFLCYHLDCRMVVERLSLFLMVDDSTASYFQCFNSSLLFCLLVSKIRRRPEWLRRPKHATDRSLIYCRCSCFYRWFLVLRQLLLSVIVLKLFLFWNNIRW